MRTYTRTRAIEATHNNAGIPANSFIKAKAEIHCFADALAFVQKQQTWGENLLPLASNVVVYVVKRRRGKPVSIAVRLYDTDIITYHANGTWEADNGGFFTPTTSTRCNQFGPYGFHFSHVNKKLVAWNPSAGGYLETGPGKRYLCGTKPLDPLSVGLGGKGKALLYGD